MMASVALPVTLQQLIAGTGVRLKSLEKKCRQEHILCLAEHCDSIDIIGMKLGLSEVQIGDIDKDHRTNEEKRVALVKKWKQSFGSNATYKKFIESLLDCGRVKNATEVCNLLVKYDHENQGAQNSPQIIEQPHMGRDQVVAELMKLEEEYTKITRNAARSLTISKKVTLKEMRCYVATLPRRVKMCYDELKTDNTLPTKTKNFTCITEFVGVINDYSDYMNPALLEDTIMEYGDEETKEMMRKYRTTLLEFLKSTTIEQFVNAAWKGVTPKDYQEIELELESDWKSKKLEDILPPKRSWLLKGVFYGSIKIIFAIADLEDLKEKVVISYFLQKHVKRVKVQNYALDFQSLAFTYKDTNPVQRESNNTQVDTNQIERIFTSLLKEIATHRKSNTHEKLSRTSGPTKASTVDVKKAGSKLQKEAKSTEGLYTDWKHRLKHFFQWRRRGHRGKDQLEKSVDVAFTGFPGYTASCNVSDGTLELNQRYQSNVLATNFSSSLSEQPEKIVSVANAAFQDEELYAEMGPEECELGEKQNKITAMFAVASGLGKSQDDLYTDMEPEKSVGVANAAFQDGELYTEMGPEECKLGEKQNKITAMFAVASGLGKSQEDLYTDMDPKKIVGVVNAAFIDGELYTVMGPEERELGEKQTEKMELSAAAAGGLGKSQEDLYTDMEPGPIELQTVATTENDKLVIPDTIPKTENLKPPVRPPKPAPRPEPPGKKEPAPPPTRAKATKGKPPSPLLEMYNNMRAGVQGVFINWGTGPEEEYSEMSPVHTILPEVYSDIESVRSPQHEPTSVPKPQPKQEEEAPLITPIDDDLYEDTEVAAAEAEKYKRISRSEQPPPPALPSKPVPKKRYSTPLPLTPLQKSINSTTSLPAAAIPEPEQLYIDTESNVPIEESLYEDLGTVLIKPQSPTFDLPSPPATSPSKSSTLSSKGKKEKKKKK